MALTAKNPETLDRFRFRIRVMATRWFRDATLAEDVTQETLTRVSKALMSGRVKNEAALPAFVLQTARHVCLQMSRHSRRERRALESLRHQPDSVEIFGPFSTLVSAERRYKVRQALERLPRADRDLVSLFFRRGLSAEEVAAMLGAKPGAIRVRKHRVLQKLRAQLSEFETKLHEREL